MKVFLIFTNRNIFIKQTIIIREKETERLGNGEREREREGKRENYTFVFITNRHTLSMQGLSMSQGHYTHTNYSKSRYEPAKLSKNYLG